jgi:F0F1-type ATP synthase assembly protein I/predicted transcriptional regulator
MKVFLQRFALSVTLVAGVTWAIGRSLGWFSKLANTPEGFAQLEGLLGLILGLLSGLAIYEVLRTFEKAAEQDQSRETVETVRRIEKSLQRKVDVVKSPSTPEEYVGLWSGYTDLYWVYNPCYRVENRPGIDQAEVIKKVFVPRYRDSKFKKAFYLFLTKDDTGKNDLNEFRTFVRETRKLCPEVVTKLEVKELTEKASGEDSEVYRGMKNGILMSVVEPREQALTGGRGTPYYYLMITDHDINERLKDQFERDWSKATKVDIFNDADQRANKPVPTDDQTRKSA